MFLLQILNETDTVSVEAKVADYAPFVRAEEEEVRVVEALSGRPTVAAVLHIAHTGAVAAARSRQEDCTCGFDF